MEKNPIYLGAEKSDQEEAQAAEFPVDPLVASNSGELTTLVYKCDSKNKVGLLLGFNGTRWNETGVVYQEFSFKNLPIKEAQEFCEKVEIALKVNLDYLEKGNDNNNICDNEVIIITLLNK